MSRISTHAIFLSKLLDSYDKNTHLLEDLTNISIEGKKTHTHINATNKLTYLYVRRCCFNIVLYIKQLSIVTTLIIGSINIRK